ncbi:MAG: hypothetical protein COS90_05630 [Deltaproteobacteria bacterium CG07_land_8_20_14_0_80_60_11]|nr:MAG: hypothetical protein COS90_05630 [Deltaproteobacteria bacterium CG07_land_8_20_14_0_80_60_11]
MSVLQRLRVEVLKKLVHQAGPGGHPQKALLLIFHQGCLRPGPPLLPSRRSRYRVVFFSDRIYNNYWVSTESAPARRAPGDI